MNREEKNYELSNDMEKEEMVYELPDDVLETLEACACGCGGGAGAGSGGTDQAI